MLNPAPTICGRFPIEVLLKLLPAEAGGPAAEVRYFGARHGRLVATSVSYVSAMFTVPADWKRDLADAAVPTVAKVREKPLTPEEQEDAASDRARHARNVRPHRPAPEIAADASALTPALKAEGGAFVTLKGETATSVAASGNRYA